MGTGASSFHYQWKCRFCQNSWILQSLFCPGIPTTVHSWLWSYLEIHCLLEIQFPSWISCILKIRFYLAKFLGHFISHAIYVISSFLYVGLFLVTSHHKVWHNTISTVIIRKEKTDGNQRVQKGTFCVAANIFRMYIDYAYILKHCRQFI